MPLSKEQVEDLMAQARKYVPQFPPIFEELLNATDISTLNAFNAQDKEPFRHTASNSHFHFVGERNGEKSEIRYLQPHNGCDREIEQAIDIERQYPWNQNGPPHQYRRTEKAERCQQQPRI